jgi:hypothetical protein
MKFYIHFATIQPRFPELEHVIKSWKDQTTPCDTLVFTTSLTDPRFVNLDLLEKFKADNVILQTLDVDYGAHNKILGALKYFGSTIDDDSYVVICDDDNRYDMDTIKSYRNSLERDNEDVVYTQFKPQQRLPDINHVQGADTYVLPAKFFKLMTYQKYLDYIQSVIAECPDALYQDDYVITYAIHELGFKIRSTFKRVSYNMAIKHGQMHQDPRVTERERNTVEFFKNKILKSSV